MEETMNLAKYVIMHTFRGECKCGKCADRGNRPDPTGHTADMIFFKVAAANDPDATAFKKLTESQKGVNPFDGEEHSYIELGAWLGDQGVALQYMALGCLLGVFDLMTPKTMLSGLPESTVMAMAGSGFVAIKKRPS
jgi:hypothetical protein